MNSGRFREEVSLNNRRTYQIKDEMIKAEGSESEKKWPRGMASHVEGLLATHFKDLGGEC